ncbi:MAG: tRNA 2-thiouridine(34) synthase MnmA [Alphaproteobacteria bacterium]
MNMLGLDGNPADHRVVVAMSGGVDSSVAAALIKDAGYDVVGITLQLYDQGEAIAASKTCCAGRDIHDARQVADQLDIPHYVLDYESRFREAVIDDFADTYLAGATPIPCVRCNQNVKFRDLLGTARDLGAAALATGHYVRREARTAGAAGAASAAGSAGAELHQARDAGRDQSYFLFATTQDQLDYLRFPLGGLPKAETRAIAQRFALPVADKPDSQDICFVPDGNYAKVIERLRPGAIEPGDIELADGTVVGRHDGVINFTVGQRRGVGIASPEPLYVLRLDPKRHVVVVGPDSALGGRSLTVGEVNWLDPDRFEGDGAAVTVKLRSAHAGAPAHVHALDGGRAEVTFDAPERAITPGQAAVFYAGTRVLGGGWIERPHSPAPAS